MIKKITNIKREFGRKMRMASAALLCALLLGAVSAALADPPRDADPRDGIYERLESLYFEKRARMKQGQPIDDLEERAAFMRDTIEALRDSIVAAGSAAPGKQAEGGFKFPEWLRLPDSLSTFDWIVVATGGVALLSLLMLIVGLILRRKNKPAEPKKRQGNHRINLAPTGTFPSVPDPRAYVAPDRKAADAAPQTRDAGGGKYPTAATLYNDMTGDRWQSGAVDTRTPGEALAGRSAPETPRDMIPAADPLGGLQSLMDNIRKVAPPPAPEPPPDEPPPLIINAPEEEAPPPKPADGGVGTGMMNFNELVIGAVKAGLNEQEISRRYQLSVDQVRLILRMNKTS